MSPNRLFEVSKFCSKRHLSSTTTANGSTPQYIEAICQFLAHRGTPNRNLAEQKNIERQAPLSDVLKLFPKGDKAKIIPIR